MNAFRYRKESCANHSGYAFRQYGGRLRFQSRSPHSFPRREAGANRSIERPTSNVQRVKIC